MRSVEFLGVLFVTGVLASILVVAPCLPTSCGPEGAEPYTFWQVALVYLSYPLAWVILGIWGVAIGCWIARARAGKGTPDRE